MTALQDARAGNKSQDVKSPVRMCSFSLDKVQLIPLRYGLVEQPDPAAELAMPYKTVAKPLGIRLVRDGWIYAVVERKQDVILHEYRIENGTISALLWRGAEVAADVRTSTVGEARMIFKRNEPLYLAYSEVQWTARKCSQVIKSGPQRNQLMQAISLTSIDALKGGKHLLTQRQAERWVAECSAATVTPEAGALPQETPYHWEHVQRYQAHSVSALRQTVSAECEQNYLFVVLQDDIGVLRDLAAYQDDVVSWINEWQQDEDRNQRYAEATYIEAQLELSKEELEKAKKIYTPEEIELIKEQHERQVEGVPFWKVWDSSVGQEGINDVIHREEMEAFLAAQRKIHQRWEQLLDRITRDRVALFGRFYRAAWYFDPTSSEQVREALAAEYSCIQDICRTDEAILAVSKQLDTMPWVLYPLAHMAEPDALAKLQEAITSRLKDLETLRTLPEQQAELATQITTLAGRLNAVSAEALAGHVDVRLDERMAAFREVISASYRPAVTVGLANALQAVFDNLDVSGQFNPADLLRPMGNAARVALLQAHALQGVTVSFASGSELLEFNNIKREVASLRSVNVSLKNQLRELKTDMRRFRKLTRAYEERMNKITELKTQRQANQVRLTALEPLLQQAMSPVGPGPGKVGYQIAGLSEAERKHFQALLRDEEALYRGARGRWSAGTMDILGLMIAFWQGCNFYNTYQSMQKNEATNVDLGRDLLITISSSFAAVQGLLTTYDLAALRTVSGELATLKITARLGRMTAILGAASYITGFLANLAKFGEAYRSYIAALNSGDRRMQVKGIMDMSTSGAQMGVNGYAGLRSTQIAVQALRAAPTARVAVWASSAGRLLMLTARVTVIGLVVSLAEVAATIAFNRSYRPEYLSWFGHTRWGTTPRFTTLDESQLALARISARPSAKLELLNKGMGLLLHFPALTLADLAKADVRIAVYWTSSAARNAWEDWSQQLEYQWVCLSPPGEALQLGLPIYDEERHTTHSVIIALSYKPTPQARPETLYLQKEGTDEPGPFALINKLNGVDLAPLRRLTVEVINEPQLAAPAATDRGAR